MLICLYFSSSNLIIICSYVLYLSLAASAGTADQQEASFSQPAYLTEPYNAPIQIDAMRKIKLPLSAVSEHPHTPRTGIDCRKNIPKHERILEHHAKIMPRQALPFNYEYDSPIIPNLFTWERSYYNIQIS